MNFWSDFGEGARFLKSALLLLSKRPAFIAPIFFCWLVVSGVILYCRYYLNISENIELLAIEVFIILFLITYTICITNVVMLELVQSAEQGKQISLLKALFETVTRDALKVIPIAIIWSVLWFVILCIAVIMSLLKKGGSSSRRPEPSLKDAAMTLSGLNTNPFSWLKVGLGMIEKVFRLVAFLALPGIAWKNRGPFASLREGFGIVKTFPVQFFSVYSLTSVAAMLMALPLIPIVYVAESDVHISNTVWTVVIIYEAIIWSLGNYLEQMSIGLLYLKHEPSLLVSGNSDKELDIFMNEVVLRIDDVQKRDEYKNSPEGVREENEKMEKINAKVENKFTSLLSFVTWFLIIWAAVMLAFLGGLLWYLNS